MDIEKVMKQLVELELELENENFHAESGLMYDALCVVEKFGSDWEKNCENLLNIIINYRG